MPGRSDQSHSGLDAQPGFVRFWLGDAASVFGGFVSAFAVQLLILDGLGGAEAVGWARAAQWSPMLLFGLVAGALLDRVRRRGVLIVAELVGGVAVGSIAVCAATGVLTLPVLLVGLFVAGSAAVFGTVAQQSLLPDLVPERLFTAASTRIEQTWTAATTVAPVVAGALVQLTSAVVAVGVDAAARIVSALTVISLGDVEPTRVVDPDAPRPRLRAQIAEGARWVYGHPMLRWYAGYLHLWFWCNAAASTVLVVFLVDDLGQTPVMAGIVVAAAGVSAVVGSGLAGAAARRWGHGRAYVLAGWTTPLGWAVVAGAGLLPGPSWAVALLGQLIFGFGFGAKGPIETTYRTLITPHRLRGRMNATIRSVNWGSLAVSSAVAGVAAAAYGPRPVIVVAAIGTAVIGTVLTLSPFRRAVLDATADGRPDVEPDVEPDADDRPAS